MMFFAKQGMKNMLRSKKTSVLLFLVLLLLTILIGTSYTASVIISRYVETCNNSYHTIGIIDYPSADLSNPYYYDESVNEAFKQTGEMIEDNHETNNQGDNSEEASCWHPTALSFGSIEGLTRNDPDIPLTEEAVLVVTVNKMQTVTEGGSYLCIVDEGLSSTKKLNGQYLYVTSDTIPLELGHTYLIYGQYANIQSAFSYLTISEFAHPLAQADGFDGSIEKMVLDITPESGDYQIPENTYFKQMVDTLNCIHNSITVYHTENVEYAYEFQQSIVQLAEGDTFSEEAYTENAKECMISDNLANILGVSIGDRIELSQAAGNDTAVELAYWAPKGYAETNSYTITGLFTSDTETRFHVYVPYDGTKSSDYSHYSNTFGELYLKNETAQTVAGELSEVLPQGVSLTVYDQGYESVMTPLQDIVQIITIIRIIVSITGVLFLFLFGYLFVYKNKDIARIMQLQGTGNAAVYVFFLAGGMGLSIPVLLIGGILNSIVASQLPGLVQLLMQMNHSMDYRFSNGNLSVHKEMEFATHGFVGNALLATIVVWIVILAVCAIFTRFSMKKHMKSHTLQNVFGKRSGHSHTGSGRYYALFSMTRGKGRVALLIVVCTMATGLFAQLSGSLSQAKDKEVQIENSTDIEGYITDIHGRSNFGMTVSPEDIKQLYQTGYLDDVNYSLSFKCKHWADGTGDVFEEEVEKFNQYMNQNEFRTAIVSDTLARGKDNIVFTTDFDHTREFINTGHPDVTFMDGITEQEFFANEDNKENVVVSENYLKENGYELGDELYLVIRVGQNNVSLIHMILAGSYKQVANGNNIYAPMNQLIANAKMTGDQELGRRESQWSLDSGMIELNGSKLDEFKDILTDLGFTEVNDTGTMRKYIVLKDSQMLNTRRSMRQQLQYMQVFFPIIEVVLEILAFLIPMLLIRSRKQEIITMRNLGTSRKQTFLNLYVEQLLISMAGILIAWILILIIRIPFTLPALALSMVFLLVWNAGSIWTIGNYNSKRIGRK